VKGLPAAGGFGLLPGPGCDLRLKNWQPPKKRNIPGIGRFLEWGKISGFVCIL